MFIYLPLFCIKVSLNIFLNNTNNIRKILLKSRLFKTFMYFQDLIFHDIL